MIILAKMPKRLNIQKCRVLLVDDHERIRDALRKLLASYEDIEIIGEARDGKQAVELVAACHPDVVAHGHQHAKDEWH